jgi:hypothetical protein
MPQQKSSYRTFEINGQIVIIDDFIYRRLFKDPDIPPRRKYTFIKGFNSTNGCTRMILKTGKSIVLSRYVMRAGKSEFVDHISRDPLDNRRCNLRIVNLRQNMLNRKMKNNTGLIGVSTYKLKNKSYVRAVCKTKAGKYLKFHCSDTPFNRILAALAHDKFVLQQGDEQYAPLNFPCWKFEPLRSILLDKDLGEYKERSNKLFIRNISQNKTLDKK